MKVFDYHPPEPITMTQEELEIIEAARSWISADAYASDSVRTSNKGYDLADALDNIIRKYRITEQDHVPPIH